MTITPCEAFLREKIISEGPIPLESFMDIALHHPEHGYYTKAPAIGKDGDFITAPEVSQMFGEIIGAWCIDMWHKFGSPTPFNLVELGPGRGTLMKDLLRVAKKSPDFLQAMNLILIERNQTLKAQQSQALESNSPKWSSDFTTAPFDPRSPTLIIANEFFDAFPVQQFTEENGKWFATHVDVKNDKLAFSNIKVNHTPPFLEHSPQAEDYFNTICSHINKHKGAMLTIDYGYEDGQGHSLQALREHSHSSPLEHVGESDLTAHVNFKTLNTIAHTAGLATAGPTTQGRFLSSLGILQRAQQLQSQNPLQIPQITSDLMRLTSPQQMGSLFKVLCAYTPHSVQPEGFQ